MSSPRVLASPNHTRGFIVEIDTSHGGIGAVLMQRGRPITYFGKVLVPKHRGKSIYEKEYMSLLNVVGKWRHYPIQAFCGQNYHYKLKYLFWSKESPQKFNKKDWQK